MLDWITDLLAAKVIDTIGVPPAYVPRITDLIADFQAFDFVLDGNWHTLDLSSIVPIGASAVNFAIRVIPTGIGNTVSFRHPYDTRNPGRTILWSQFVAVNKRQVWCQGIDELRHCEYKFSNVVWTGIILLVRGWWL